MNVMTIESILAARRTLVPPAKKLDKSALLSVRSLSKRFGALEVSRNVDLDIKRGERLALIGPNGAGKTTFVNLITGVLKPSSGSIEFEGLEITRLSQNRRVRAGIGRTFQISSLFRDMTVFENIYLAVSERRGTATRLFGSATRDTKGCGEVMDILGILRLADEASRPLAEISYGRQRLVELAIALALRPRLLLLDEPAAGIPEDETEIVLRGIESLPAEMAILMIDHDMDLVFRFAERIVVLVDGAIFRIGTPAEIARDPEIKRLYLGE